MSGSTRVNCPRMRFGNETLRTLEFGDAKPIETLLAPALRFRTMWGLKGFDKDKAKTFRPKRNHRVGTKRYELHKYAQATLGTGNLHDAVTLPEGEDEREWLAVNTVDFFNEINLLYGVIAEFCTESDCPVMCAGPKFEYMWADGHTIKKPITVSAPRYVDFLMQWVQAQLDDEAIFPTEIGTDADLSTQSQPPSFLCLTPHVRVCVGVPFPQDFVDRVQNIFKRLFRVYAHIYYCHFERMAALGAEPHLNTCARRCPFFLPAACRTILPYALTRAPDRRCFKHYMYFVYEFNLIPNKQELAPLQELIDKLLERDRPTDAAASAAQPSSSATPIAAEPSRPGSGEK